VTHWPPDLAEHILEAMAVGFIAIDPEQRITYLNAEAEQLTGTVRSAAIGAGLWDVFPGAIDSEFGQAYRRVQASGGAESVETFYPAPLNRWYESRLVPHEGGVHSYFLDITELRGSQELLQLSVEVGERLVGSLSVDDAVSALARLVVPRLADWTVIALIEPDGSLRDVQTWHRDPALHDVVDRYAAVRLVDGGSGIVQEVVATARPIVIDSGVIEVGLARLPSETAKQALIATQSDSVAVVPLTADNHVAGVLSLYRGFDRPPMTAQELAVTLSMCRRAGMAIDNARLYADQARRSEHDRTVAQALQQALLTELPNPAGLQLAARYFPAADDDQVGGDWYDAVCQPDGSTVVMIGDVVGHDIKAAASMGQLRSMLRMLAWSSNDGPGAILSRLDEAVRGLNLHTLATVLMVRIAPGSANGTRTVRWSTAGHLPPILLHPDGTTEVLRVETPDVLIGFAPDERRDDHAATLPPGATLLLYTDGLVERRDSDIDAGVDRLRTALSRHHARPVADFLDSVLAEMVGVHADDDIAVLAVRSDSQVHAGS
jgi:PAS domain S-box-containing protein